MSVFSVLADILFVGHSLVGPTLPVMLDAALNQMNEPSQVQAQIINGASLAYNWDHAAGAEGVGRVVAGGREHHLVFAAAQRREVLHQPVVVVFAVRVAARRERTARIQLQSRAIGEHIYHPAGEHELADGEGALTGELLVCGGQVNVPQQLQGPLIRRHKAYDSYRGWGCNKPDWPGL